MAEKRQDSPPKNKGQIIEPRLDASFDDNVWHNSPGLSRMCKPASRGTVSSGHKCTLITSLVEMINEWWLAILLINSFLLLFLVYYGTERCSVDTSLGSNILGGAAWEEALCLHRESNIGLGYGNECAIRIAQVTWSFLPNGSILLP